MKKLKEIFDKEKGVLFLGAAAAVFSALMLGAVLEQVFLLKGVELWLVCVLIGILSFIVMLWE